MRYGFIHSIAAVCLIVALIPLIIATLTIAPALASNSYGVSAGRGRDFIIGRAALPPEVLVNESVLKLVQNYLYLNQSNRMMKLINPQSIRYQLTIELRLITTSNLGLNTSVAGYVFVGKAIIKYELSNNNVSYRVLKGCEGLSVARLKLHGLHGSGLAIKVSQADLRDRVLINVTKLTLSKSPEAPPFEARLSISVIVSESIKRGLIVEALVLLGGLLATVVAALLVIMIKSRIIKSLLINSDSSLIH